MGDLKYKEPIELMAEEITGLGDFDPLAKTFILGQGDYPTGHRIVEVTAEEVRELRRIVSDEQARSVALTARVKELEQALREVREEICRGPVNDILWHQETPAETTVDFITNTLNDNWSYDAWLSREAAFAKGDADG